MDADLARRIARVEAYDHVRRLAFDYAQAIDTRDLEKLGSLYVEDYADPTLLRATGRAAVVARLEKIIRQCTTSMHLVGNHVIHLDDEDHAHGVVYTRAEHEVGDKWVVMYLHYWDQYDRRDGRWYFKLRQPKQLYAVDMLERPVGPLKGRWPGTPLVKTPLPEGYPSWGAFWASQGRTP